MRDATSPLTLPADTRSPEELLKAGGYDYVDGRARDFILSKEFAAEEDSGEITLEMLQFDHKPCTEEVLHNFKKEGLLRPTARDCLRFGVHYQHIQLKRPLAFLHEPWSIAPGFLRVLYITGFGKERHLWSQRFEQTWEWDVGFPTRRPNT